MKRITGSFFEFDHHNRAEGKYFNETMWHFTETQWRTKIREISTFGIDTLVLLCTVLYDEAYFDWSELPYAVHLRCKNVLDVLLDEGMRCGISVFLSVGFYGDWEKPWINISDEAVIAKSIRAMHRLHTLYGDHPAVIGWYMPDEICINGCFDEPFVTYVNRISAEAKALRADYKTIISPYGTKLAVPDDRYTEQLIRMNVDYIAYQDEVGVYKSTPAETAVYYRDLRAAHDRAQAMRPDAPRLWANVETFCFEEERYTSALLGADGERVRSQLTAVSPYAEKVICYTYQGMISAPDGIVLGERTRAEALYRAYQNFFLT